MGSFRGVTYTSLGVLLLLNIMGCADSYVVELESSAPEELTYEINEDDPKAIEAVIEQSCAIASNEGDIVDSQTLDEIQKNPKVITGPFEKSYPSAWIESLFSASLDSTIETVQKLGVLLFKAPARFKQTCRAFSGLKKPFQKDLIKYTADWFKNPKDEKASYRKGIFVYSRNGESSIILREDSDRWTLLHEFMHYSFYTQKDLNRLSFGDLQASYTTGRDQLLKVLEDKEDNEDEEETTEVTVEAVAETPKEEKIKAALELWTPLSQTLIELLTHYQLEEISIEYLLIQAQKDGKLKNIPTRSTYQKTWYFLENTRQAKDLLWGAMQFNNTLIEESAKLKLTLDTDKDALIKKNKDQFSKIWNQIDKLTFDLSKEKPTHSHMSEESEPTPVHKPCVQSKSLESMTQDMTRLRGLLR